MFPVPNAVDRVLSKAFFADRVSAPGDVPKFGRRFSILRLAKTNRTRGSLLREIRLEAVMNRAFEAPKDIQHLKVPCPVLTARPGLPVVSAGGGRDHSLRFGRSFDGLVGVVIIC